MQDLKILVPTDLSEIGNKAFKDALYVAELFGGTITPMYVMGDTDDILEILDIEDPGSQKRKIYEHLEKRMHTIVNELLPPDRVSKPIIETGDVAANIVKAAIRHDMIVMSTHGRKGISRVMVGSVAKKVIRTTARPVMVVEKTSELIPINKILVSTDFSEHSEKAFPYAVDFAKRTGARVDLVHMVSAGPFKLNPEDEVVNVAGKKLKEIKEKYFSELGDKVKTEALITTVSISEALTNLIYSRDYNLVFMSTLGTSNLNNLIIGSVASTVIRMVDTAIVSINPRGEG